MEFDKLFTESVLNGIRSGDRCALDQLQTIIHAMIDEIIRLEKNNEKLRNRGQLMVTNYADLERQILELKCKKSADLDESRQEIIRLKLQVQRALGDANNQALVTDSDKKTLERVVEEKNRFLIKIKAENLVLKNQLEEQGLTIAQSLSDSAITHGVVVQLRHALDSIVALQNLNQSLLESYAHDLRQSQHSYTKTRLLNDELQLTISSLNEKIRIKDDRIAKLELLMGSWQQVSDASVSHLESELESATESFQRLATDLGERGEKFFSSIYKLAASAKMQLENVSRDGNVHRQEAGNVSLEEPITVDHTSKAIDVTEPLVNSDYVNNNKNIMT